MTQSTRWFWLAVFSISLILLYLLAPILLPFISAALLAYLGDPLVDRLEKTRLTRTMSVAVVFVFLIAVIVPLVLFSFSLLQEQLATLVGKLPDYIEWTVTNLSPMMKDQFGIALPSFDMAQLKKTFTEEWVNAGGFFKGLIRTVSHSGLIVAGWMANIVLI